MRGMLTGAILASLMTFVPVFAHAGNDRNLTVVGTVDIQSGAIKDATIVNADLVNLTIGSGKMAVGSVDSEKLANNAVNADHINSSAVTTAKVAALAIGSAKIAALSVDSEKLAGGSVNTEKIRADSIDTGKLLFGTAIGSGKIVCIMGGNLSRFGVCASPTISAGGCDCN
mgnify:CR=1 FL=1